MSNQVWRLKLEVDASVDIDPITYSHKEGIYSSETQALEALAMFFRANIKRMLSHDIFVNPRKGFKAEDIDGELEDQFKAVLLLKKKLIKFYNSLSKKLQPIKHYQKFIEKNFNISEELTIASWNSRFSEVIENAEEALMDNFFFPIAMDSGDEYDETWGVRIMLESFELDQWLETEDCGNVEDLPETIEE
jgi:hypothetical protein